MITDCASGVNQILNGVIGGKPLPLVEIDRVGDLPLFAGFKYLNAGLFGDFPGKAVVICTAEPRLQADEISLRVGPYGKEREGRTVQGHIGSLIGESDAHRPDILVLKDPRIRDVILPGGPFLRERTFFLSGSA